MAATGTRWPVQPVLDKHLGAVAAVSTHPDTQDRAPRCLHHLPPGLDDVPDDSSDSDSDFDFDFDSGDGDGDGDLAAFATAGGLSGMLGLARAAAAQRRREAKARRKAEQLARARARAEAAGPHAFRCARVVVVTSHGVATTWRLHDAAVLATNHVHNSDIAGVCFVCLVCVGVFVCELRFRCSPTPDP